MKVSALKETALISLREQRKVKNKKRERSLFSDFTVRSIFSDLTENELLLFLRS